MDSSSVKSSLSDENLLHRPTTANESSSSRTLPVSSTQVAHLLSSVTARQSRASNGHKKQNSLPESVVLQIVTGAPLLSSPISSPLQHIKRKLQSGRAESYDLVKVTDRSSTTNQALHTYLFRQIYTACLRTQIHCSYH